MSAKTRVGIVGYGSLGKYLVNAILNDEKVSANFELAFVWNRSAEKLNELPENVRLLDLENVEDFSGKVDLIAEVSHPKIVQEYGLRFLKIADFFIGSPTALADAKTEKILREYVQTPENKHAVYIPSGALWGAHDIAKMASLGTLHGLTITMKKHPLSLKLEEPLNQKVEEYIASKSTKECVIYEGPTREVCFMAPNNVNTMACAALAGHNLGFDKVVARLVADVNLEAHIVDIDVYGSPQSGFKVSTSRFNPAKPGAVTGNATYGSFLSSLKLARAKGPGIHFL